MGFLFGRARKYPDAKLVERLHETIVAAVRRPGLYLDYGVEDTFEGRFELLVLHAWLMLRRLNAAPPPGPALAQDLVDHLFRALDAGLREAGVGDLAVPKRMKTLAEAFLGRSAAYAEALELGGAGLAEALSRNVYAAGGDAHRLAAYVGSAARGLDAAPLESILDGSVSFPALATAQDSVGPP